MFGFTLRTNFNDLCPALRDNPKPARQPAPAGETLDYTSAANQLTALKYNAGFDAPEILQHGNTLYMTGEQYRYRDPREAVDRANRILINNLPDGVDTIAITQQRDHLPLVTTQTDVASLRKQLAGQPLGRGRRSGSSASSLWIPQHSGVATVFAPIASATALNRRWRSRWAVRKISICSVGVMASASYWLTDRLLLDGGVFANLYNNYDKFKSSLLPADSSLPRVRTHIRDYVSNDVYINNLQANYVDALGNGFYAQIYGGYLETMYGGVEQRRSGARWIATGRWAWMRITSSSATGTT